MLTVAGRPAGQAAGKSVKGCHGLGFGPGKSARGVTDRGLGQTEDDCVYENLENTILF